MLPYPTDNRPFSSASRHSRFLSIAVLSITVISISLNVFADSLDQSGCQLAREHYFPKIAIAGPSDLNASNIIRAELVFDLGKTCLNQTTIAFLSNLLRKDPFPPVRKAAATVLAWTRNKSAQNALVSALNDPCVDVRIASAIASTKLPNSPSNQAAKSLYSIASNPDDKTWHKESRKGFKKCTDCPDCLKSRGISQSMEFRLHAIQALGLVKSTRTPKYLSKLSTNPNPELRDEAKRILQTRFSDMPNREVKQK